MIDGIYTPDTQYCTICACHQTSSTTGYTSKTPPKPSEIRENLEHKGDAIFGIPFVMQSNAERRKKILGAL
jgi:hypothetical protein